MRGCGSREVNDMTGVDQLQEGRGERAQSDRCGVACASLCVAWLRLRVQSERANQSTNRAEWMQRTAVDWDRIGSDRIGDGDGERRSRRRKPTGRKENRRKSEAGLQDEKKEIIRKWRWIKIKIMHINHCLQC
jgi:hypothetical protein